MTLTVVVIAAGIPQQLPIKNIFVFVFNIDIDLGGLNCGEILWLPMVHSEIHSNMVSTSLTEVEYVYSMVKTLMGKPRNPHKWNTFFTYWHYRGWCCVLPYQLRHTCLFSCFICAFICHVYCKLTHTQMHTQNIFNYLPLFFCRIRWGAKAATYHHHYEATGDFKGCLCCKPKAITSY